MQLRQASELARLLRTDPFVRHGQRDDERLGCRNQRVERGEFPCTWGGASGQQSEGRLLAGGGAGNNAELDSGSGTVISSIDEFSGSLRSAVGVCEDEAVRHA